MSTTFVAQNKLLYFSVAIASLAIFLIALGPGLYNEPLVPYVSWQHLAFNDLCHQNPSRSFLLNGTSMAVCARCIGIYSSLCVGWLLMPLLVNYTPPSKKTYYKLLIGAIFLNLIDVMVNAIGFWQNTNSSRFLLGTLISLSLISYLTNDFFNLKEKEVISYGE